MRCFTVRHLAFHYSLLLCVGAVIPIGQGNAQPGFEISMSKNLQSATDVSAYASMEDAQEYLVRTLPIATANNPNYRSSADGVEMAWITQSIKFAPGRNGSGMLVSMSEAIFEFRNGVRAAAGSHQVEFSIEDVKISERRDGADLTASGEIALGVIFNCNSGKCIRSTYNGEASAVDWTDISIQDDALRGQILKAFETIQQAAGGGNQATGAKSP
jgi:hypothetical protein